MVSITKDQLIITINTASPKETLSYLHEQLVENMECFHFSISENMWNAKDRSNTFMFDLLGSLTIDPERVLNDNEKDKFRNLID